MRLLIAEDDTRLLKSLKHIFELNQYSVDAVSNGMDALAYAESEEYDGLVLDIMMPGLDGVEVLKRLREKGISTPALFLTAKTEIYQRVEGLDAGADDYLPKPFSIPELLCTGSLYIPGAHAQPFHLRAAVQKRESGVERPGVSNYGNAHGTPEFHYPG